jgi:hypothetical protein
VFANRERTASLPWAKAELRRITLPRLYGKWSSEGISLL